MQLKIWKNCGCKLGSQTFECHWSQSKIFFGLATINGTKVLFQAKKICHGCQCLCHTTVLHSNRYTLYWIGLRESSVPGHFIWQHSSKPLTWSNWRKGEPNMNNEHCVLMYGFDKWQWNNYPCGKNQEGQDIRALCEYAH